jgi:UDPglucose 6-dehydrogenase
MKISFINAISRICDKVGADVEKVAEGIGLDKRIGKDFLKAGIGYGGSCFPKDVDAFIHISEKLGYDFKLLKEVKRINEEQRKLAIHKVKEVLWILKDKQIGIWGASFKPNTDDIRGAPAIDVIQMLLDEGAHVKVYDPHALENLKGIFGSSITYCKDKYEAVEDADCLILVTEWEEFKQVDFDKLKDLMRLPFILDCRNFYSPEEMEAYGFTYISFGRPVKGKAFSRVKR